jgi:hypothetical protein
MNIINVFKEDKYYRISDFLIYPELNITVISTRNLIIYYCLRNKKILAVVKLDITTTKYPVKKLIKIDE